MLYKIRRGGSPPYRPELNDDGMMVNPALVSPSVQQDLGDLTKGSVFRCNLVILKVSDVHNPLKSNRFHA